MAHPWPLAGKGVIMVEMRVRVDGEEVLSYTFRSVSEAAEIIQFLSDFFPNGQFLVQPLSH